MRRPSLRWRDWRNLGGVSGDGRHHGADQPESRIGSGQSKLRSLHTAPRRIMPAAKRRVTNSSGCYFNDIDTGTISMPCAAGPTLSPNCTVSASGNTIGDPERIRCGSRFRPGDGPRLDECGECGEPLELDSGHCIVDGYSHTTPGSIVSNQSISVAVTVAGGSGTPTGTVTLSGGGYSSPAKEPDCRQRDFQHLRRTLARQARLRSRQVTAVMRRMQRRAERRP